MQIFPKKGYVLVSIQNVTVEKKAGSLILMSDEKKREFLKLESDGEIYKKGDSVFMQPYKQKIEADDNLFLIAEDDIIASFNN